MGIPTEPIGSIPRPLALIEPAELVATVASVAGRAGPPLAAERP